MPFQSQRLVWSPGWAHSERFDIQATAPEAPPAGISAADREARTRLMLQTPLKERFGLVIRREMKELYALVASKKGAKLTKAAIGESECPAQPPDDGCIAIT